MRYGTALLAVAGFCLTSLCAPSYAKGGGHSYRTRYSLRSHSSTRAYSAPSYRRTRRIRGLTVPKLRSDIPRVHHSDGPTALYHHPRKSAKSGDLFTTPHRTSPRPVRLARLAPSVGTSRRKPARADNLPRRVSAWPGFYRTGIPEHRSEAEKKKFLRQQGLKRVPPGMEVDHIVPLSAGGSDIPANMELLPKSTHHRKTAVEAKRYGWHKKR